MRCPSLADLPPPPPGKTGWPWTEETPPLPPARDDGSPWPRISIVTPSYNQGQFIEETIRSVLLQGYPDLEYIIMDGGSSDQSVEIIKKYERWLTCWVSEKDRGQAHAINKGFVKTSGEIFQWINSDDVVLRGAFGLVAGIYNGEAIATPMLCGYTADTATSRVNSKLSVACVLDGSATFSQPGLWLPRRKMMDAVLDERLHYAFDWDMLLRYLEKHEVVTYRDEATVFFRHHQDSKTISHSNAFAREGHFILSKLSRTFTEPAHLRICRKELHQRNWHRRVQYWRIHSEDGRYSALTLMVLLALRQPKVRMTRFWFGAVRRTAFKRCAVFQPRRRSL